MSEENEKQGYNYLSNIYSETNNPKNDYPYKLANIFHQTILKKITVLLLM